MRTISGMGNMGGGRIIKAKGNTEIPHQETEGHKKDYT